MSSVCFYFQVHQPYRLREYRVFDIGSEGDYFSSKTDSNLNNLKVLNKVAEKSYLPANEVMLELLNTYPEFKISYSFSGILLEQLQTYRPDVLDSFRRLVDTGRVEILSETYYHSLSFLYSPAEFKRQIKLHKQKVKEIFDYSPKVFRNTELIYNNDLAEFISQLGFKAVIAEGADHVLNGRSPNYLYSPKLESTQSPLVLLLKNYKLSDDIAFRFSSHDWAEYPLTASKFGHWLSAINGNGELVNLFMDYETFGEHQWADSGIFSFVRSLPAEILKHPDNDFVTPTEAASIYTAKDTLDVPEFMSWADIERDLSAWRSNALQTEALDSIYKLEKQVLATHDPALIDDWRKLQTSDHFYYMCTKWFADGDVHKYFNPYESPYMAFVNFMNVLQDLKLRLQPTTY